MATGIHQPNSGRSDLVLDARQPPVVGVLPPLGRTPPASGTGDVVLDRAEYEIAWYEKHATASRVSYCAIKLLQILLAAFVPVAVGVNAPRLVTGSLGGLVVVLEGVQQLFRFHDNWIRYRQTSEDMLREKYLYAGSAGDYADTPSPRRLLAERIESLASREAHQWVNLQKPEDAKGGNGKAMTGGHQYVADQPMPASTSIPTHP
jgi:Protein of unknown function (DUF4231)